MTAINLTIKKHWSVYVIPAVILLLSLFSVFVSFSVKTKWLSIGLLVFGTFFAISKTVKLLQLASVKWTFNGDELHVTRGFLPWNKTRIQIPIFDIYDSSVSSGFLGHYLNFGHISIRRTEGMTSQLSERHLGRAVHFSGIVNQYVQEYKKGKNDVNIIQGHEDDLVIKLQRLVDLKNSGALSEEEFAELKKRLIKT